MVVYEQAVFIGRCLYCRAVMYRRPDGRVFSVNADPACPCESEETYEEKDGGYDHTGQGEIVDPGAK